MHVAALASAVPECLDALVNNASILGPSPQPALLDYPLETLEEVYFAIEARLGVPAIEAAA